MNRKNQGLIAVVAVVLLCSLVIGVIGYLSKGFRNWDASKWFKDETSRLTDYTCQTRSYKNYLITCKNSRLYLFFALGSPWTALLSA